MDHFLLAPLGSEWAVGSASVSPVDYENGQGRWRSFRFLANGTLTITEAGLVEYLIVAGGGGGGRSFRSSGDVPFGGGGGGAGGLLAGQLTLAPGDYAVVIGAGGLAATAAGSNWTNGGDSSAFGLTAIGGGKGGLGASALCPGVAGGSGGGAGANSIGPSQPGGAGTTGQGFAGGNAIATGGSGAGGGGAAGVGSDRNANIALGATGGLGFESTIAGSLNTYARGGKGGQASGGVAPTANTGNGGDGANVGATLNTTYAAFDGASGIVIVRFAI